jgi:hypothetical protein
VLTDVCGHLKGKLRDSSCKAVRGENQSFQISFLLQSLENVAIDARARVVGKGNFIWLGKHLLATYYVSLCTNHRDQEEWYRLPAHYPVFSDVDSVKFSRILCM